METNKKGKVYLIGAGPGDVGLLTLKAAELLKTAHVVVFDRLVGQDILKLINNNALLIDVGKTAGNHPVPQHRINEVLVEQASQGKIVARLKGGDCFVFGRGGEEAERLVQAGIPFEIVPGITSAIAVPAYAGIPVTHRDLATSFHVITGHEREGKDGGIDFEPLAKLNGTLVFLMGVGNLQHIVQSLMAHGKSPQTPVAMIERGTTYAQRSISGDLQSIVQIATEANIQSPAIIVVGEVVTLKDRLSWREKLPLWGKRIVVTRARMQASDMVQRLAQLGAQVV
ncbi:MAG: uroporphyrinogen-III C-methyltransferase, partial [Hyphomonadaceae bacterium]|nr:uroporphyrinogen-III C-methyltransferase [Clostridia bacterium]